MKTNADMRELVSKGYADIAQGGGSCCGPAKRCCGSGDAAGVAKTVGYSDAELATLPNGANMGFPKARAVRYQSGCRGAQAGPDAAAVMPLSADAYLRFAAR